MSNDPYAAPQDAGGAGDRPTSYPPPPAYPQAYPQTGSPSPAPPPAYGPPPGYHQPQSYGPPSGQYPPAYGPPPGYGPPTYGAPWGARTASDVFGRPLAGWWSRVGAFLIDQLIAFVPWIVAAIYAEVTGTPGYDRVGGPTTVPTAAGSAALLLGLVLLIGVWGWNRWYRQGRTGQSIGKQALGIRLVHQPTGANPEGGRALGRDMLHLLLDGWFYLGYLWPLWDTHKQTFADKACGTIVVRG